MPERVTVGVVETAWGPMVLATTERGILVVERGDDVTAVLAEIQRRLPAAEPISGRPAHATWLRDWVYGGRNDLAPIDARGVAPFDATVFEAVRGIRWGERATYGDVAVVIGHPGAARAVGSAMSRCPLFPAVPCHRVVRAADGWSGWGTSGDRLKRELLDRELPEGR